MVPWSSAKAKVQLRLSVQRLRILQDKKGAQAKTTRRDIATLIERGKLETARVKTENIINEDIHVELLELLELYCELLLARFGLLEQNTREPDPGVKEGVCSIIHAAPRTELKELHILRELLMQKYGREFAIAAMENRDDCVSERVMRKLSIAMPPPDLVDGYLAEIAKGYNIAWTPPNRKDNDNDDGGGGGLKASIPSRSLELPIAMRADPAPQSPSTSSAENVPGLPKLPDIPPTEGEGDYSSPPKSTSTAAGTKPTSSSPPANVDLSSPPPPEDDFAALTRRFDALKRR